MPKVIAPNQLQREIGKALKSLEGVGEKEANFAYRYAGIKLFSAIIVASPVDNGRFRASWLVSTGTPARGTRNEGQKDKGEGYVAREFPKDAINVDKIYLTNNLPYANTLEFGRYPVPVKQGTLNKKTGRYEQRSINGYSKQAPYGMVRLNAMRFKKWVQRGVALA